MKKENKNQHVNNAFSSKMNFPLDRQHKNYIDTAHSICKKVMITKPTCHTCVCVCVWTCIYNDYSINNCTMPQ